MRSFFAAAKASAEGRGEREKAIKEFESLGAKFGGSGPFIGALWDELPRDYKGGPSHSRKAVTKGGGSHKRPAGKRPVAGFAVVHSTEKPWVKEPNYKRWLQKLKRHTRRKSQEEHPANMCVDSDLCKGDLGIPRRLMPQFNSEKDIKNFVAFAENRYGIKSRKATRRASSLKPSQEEINRERVEDVADDIRYKKLDPKVPLIVSKDSYVIDGHHRWAAFKKDKPTYKMPVLLVEAPARDVLSVAATWGARHQQF